MCGFLAYRDGPDRCVHYVKRRGPDCVNTLQLHGFTFIHYLLHVTGARTPQPFVEDAIVCLFNGEIYNHSFIRSDGEVLIPLYKKHGIRFAEHLDGEYAIALYDFAERHAIFCTDPFGTKPLWVNGLDAASYASCVGGVEVRPNTLLRCGFDGRREEQVLHHFDFDHQEKRTYEAWEAAFQEAVKKRAMPGCFIGLSSGYDSGAIACELIRQKCGFSAYGVRGSEDRQLLGTRLAQVSGKMLECSRDEYDAWKSHIKAHAEEYDYSAVYGGPRHCSNMTDDWGAVGSAVLYNEARRNGQKVCLCGQGADEILSDYSLYPEVSTLYGVFPEKLRPWPNFQGGCQRAYLRKEEHIAGCFGIEARYPFLDRRVVQEFLWLHPAWKNRVYKAPIDSYLTRHGYQFNKNKKVGFSAV